MRSSKCFIFHIYYNKNIAQQKCLIPWIRLSNQQVSYKDKAPPIGHISHKRYGLFICRKEHIVSERVNEFDRLQELIDRIDRQLIRRSYTWGGSRTWRLTGWTTSTAATWTRYEGASWHGITRRHRNTGKKRIGTSTKKKKSRGWEGLYRPSGSFSLPTKEWEMDDEKMMSIDWDGLHTFEFVNGHPRDYTDGALPWTCSMSCASGWQSWPWFAWVRYSGRYHEKHNSSILHSVWLNRFRHRRNWQNIRRCMQKL